MQTIAIGKMTDFVVAAASAIDCDIGKQLEAEIAEEGERSESYEMIRHDLLEALDHFGIEVVEEEE